MRRLIDFPFFTGRRVLLSVGLRGPEVFDSNLTEAQVRDLCMAEAKVALAEYKGDASWFDVRKVGTETEIKSADGNLSLSVQFELRRLGRPLGNAQVGQDR